MNRFKDFFSIENRTKYFIHTMAFLCITSAVVFAICLIGNNALDKKETKVEQKISKDPFKDIKLEAKAAFILDVVNGRSIFGKNQDQPLPLASLTKVMTAIVAASDINDNSLVQIDAKFLEPDGDSGLKIGDSWNARDLRDFTLLTSSNDGALALAVAAEKNFDNNPEAAVEKFVKEMNDEASKIGLSSSKFFNEHGLDREADRGGAYGSARDMASLFEYTLKNYPEVLEATRYKNLEFNSSQQKYLADNTNGFVDMIPGLIASKTGYTDLAGGNLVVVYDAGLNRPIIVSILGSSQDGRFTDALKLIEASLKYIHDN